MYLKNLKQIETYVLIPQKDGWPGWNEYFPWHEFHFEGGLWYSPFSKSTYGNGPLPFKEAVDMWYKIDLSLRQTDTKEEEKRQFFLGSTGKMLFADHLLIVHQYNISDDW